MEKGVENSSLPTDEFESKFLLRLLLDVIMYWVPVHAKELPAFAFRICWGSDSGGFNLVFMQNGVR